MKQILPLGWISIELENHVYIAGRIGWRGLKRSEYTEVGPRFLAVKNILPNGQVDFADTDHLSQSRYDESPEIQLKINDILLTKDGTIGKVGIIDNLPGPTTVNSSILVVRPNNDLLTTEYLFYYLRGPKFQQIASERITGSAIPHLFQKDIKKLCALVPPLMEQRRIVTKLEELLNKVEKCQQRLAKIPAFLKRFRQSVLAAACSGRLTADWRDGGSFFSMPGVEGQGITLPEIPTSWVWRKLPTLGEMSRGKSRYRPRNDPSLYGGPYPFIQTGDIAQSNGRITKHKQTYNEVGLAQSRLWDSGTICITIAANIAESAILTYPACFPDSVVGLNVDAAIANAEYVEYCIRVAKADLSTFAPATAQKNINISILNEVQIPLPPVDEQHEIVRRVAALFALADQIEARYQKAKAQVDKLAPALLAKAFRGELVPQDPNDEPASALLERIRAIQKNDEIGKRKKRGRPKGK